MAQLTEIVLTCDVHDGDSEAVGTVGFTVEGQSYECELCEDHLAEFREAMEVWSSHARPCAIGRHCSTIQAAWAKRKFRRHRPLDGRHSGVGEEPGHAGEFTWPRSG